MDKTQQECFRKTVEQRLVENEQEIAALVVESEAISPDVSIGRLSRLDSMQHQQLALANKRRHEDEQNRLHEALRRIDAGNYGHCLLCHQDIERERLELQPAAVTCVPCLKKK